MTDEQAEKNIRAFLTMVRAAEGTSGPNGYRMLFGGGLFDSFSKHPDKRIPFTQTDGRRNWSTAAGAYQILYGTWRTLQRRLDLPDFGPRSQDSAAIELIREAGALSDVRDGRLAQAIDKVRRIWASMPSSPYPQPTRSEKFVYDAYANAGGIVA